MIGLLVSLQGPSIMKTPTEIGILLPKNLADPEGCAALSELLCPVSAALASLGQTFLRAGRTQNCTTKP